MLFCTARIECSSIWAIDMMAMGDEHCMTTFIDIYRIAE
jgi:hypothetical protein